MTYLTKLVIAITVVHGGVLVGQEIRNVQVRPTDAIAVTASIENLASEGKPKIFISATATNTGKVALTYDDSSSYRSAIGLLVNEKTAHRTVCKIEVNIVMDDGHLKQLEPGASFSISAALDDFKCPTAMRSSKTLSVLWNSGYFGINPVRMIKSNQLTLTGIAGFNSRGKS